MFSNCSPLYFYPLLYHLPPLPYLLPLRTVSGVIWSNHISIFIPNLWVNPVQSEVLLEPSTSSSVMLECELCNLWRQILQAKHPSTSEVVLIVRSDITTLVTGNAEQRVTQTRNCKATSGWRESTKLWFNAKEEKTGDKGSIGFLHNSTQQVVVMEILWYQI